MAKKKPKDRMGRFIEWVKDEGLYPSMMARMAEMDQESPRPTNAQQMERLILEYGWTEPSADEVANAPVVMSYEDAVADLPTATPKGVSTFAWIASHPKMPAAHEKVGNRVVIINGDDILKTPCGPAPSKEAAAALRQYVNAPDLFWKAWVANQSKLEGKIVTDAFAEVEEDEGLIDAEKMLLEIKSRRKT